MTKNRSKSKFKKSKDDKSKKIKVSKNLVKNLNHDNDSKDSVKKIHKIKVKPDKVKKKDFENVNIKKFQTLEEYKLYISQICTRAITYPETELNNVNLLFNVIEKKGGGPDNLLEYVKNLSILSLVSVVCHLLPRVSHELSEVNLEVVKRTETAHSANVIAQEREITNKTIEIRDKLISLIKNNLNYDPDFFVPLISKLVEADNRVSDELLALCLKYSKVSESCLESINSLFTYGSIVDIHRYLKFMLKSSHINHKVIRIINEIQINKKHHEFLLSEGSLKNEKTSKSKSNKEDKYKNEILSGIITFYTKTLRQCKNYKLMESCIEGLGKFGLLLEESVQVELLLEFKRLVNEFIDKDVKNYSLIIAGINTIIKIVKLMTNFEYNWVYEVFTKLSTRIVPLLFQGELAFNKQEENGLDDGDDSNGVMKEEYSVYYSWPCVTIKFLKCLENITNLLLKSNIISDFQIISQLVQVLVSISLLVGSDVAVPLMYYVNDIISKTPKLQAILSREGIVFSVLTKGKSSYWDLKLLKSHYSPYISSLFNQSKDPNTIVLKPKQTHTPMDLKGVDVSKFYNQSGLEMYQILFSVDFFDNLKTAKY